MKIIISDEYIEGLARVNNLKITDIGKVKKHLRWKANDEATENGATYLCIFIEQLLNFAYEDNAGIERSEGGRHELS